jgi:hypothetical protein
MPTDVALAIVAYVALACCCGFVLRALAKGGERD